MPETSAPPADEPPPGDWEVLVRGDERRFHPLYVALHEDSLRLAFGRAFEERAWLRTKDAVKASGARFAREIEAWLLPVGDFTLDRVPGLTVLVDAEARTAIDGARNTRRQRFEHLPPAARQFRPSIRQLTLDEIRAHPTLSEAEKGFACDVRNTRPADLSPRQRDWLKRIEERHRARLEEDPALVEQLFLSRAERIAPAARARPGASGAPSPTPAPSAPARVASTAPPVTASPGTETGARRITPSNDASRETQPTPPGNARTSTRRRIGASEVAPLPAPVVDQPANGSATHEPPPARTSIDEAEVVLFQPRIEDLAREDLRGLSIFRADDRTELRRILSGGTSIWANELQLRLDSYLAAHPEVRRALFESHAARRLAAEADADERQRCEGAKDDDRFELPRGFRRENLTTGDLHSYQRKGARWLLTVRRGILAHDVGLGKTVQAIAAAAALMDAGRATRALIVVPKPRLVGWEREIRRFTDREVVAVFGDRDARLAAYHRAAGVPFVIVGYHALQREVPELDALGADVLIVDEAHRLKGTKTLASVGFRKLASAPYAFFLTATPMPNRPEELHALLGHLHPKLLGTLWGDFAPRYAIVERLRLRRRRRPVFHVKGYRNLDELKQRISPYVFLKSATDPDVSLDLPPLRELIVELGMAAEQEELYGNLRQDAAKTLAAIDPRRFGPRERASLLTHILRLEQVAISPLLVDHGYRGANPKIDEAVELIVERLERDAPGTLVFCRFLDALGALRRALEHRGVDAARIASIEGSVPAAEIDAIEHGFRTGRFRVLLASDAAKEGLNLQGCADLLIHLDVPWVPNVVHQRNGRIYRQGQHRPVTIMHFRVPKTIEERKAATLARKSGWIAEVLGSGVASIETALRLDDLRALLADDAAGT